MLYMCNDMSDAFTASSVVGYKIEYVGVLHTIVGCRVGIYVCLGGNNDTSHGRVEVRLGAIQYLIFYIAFLQFVFKRRQAVFAINLDARLLIDSPVEAAQSLGI